MEKQEASQEETIRKMSIAFFINEIIGGRIHTISDSSYGSRSDDGNMD